MSEKKPMNRSKYVAPQEQGAIDRKLAATSPSHEDIAALAYALWEDRGGGDGRAEEDWLETERMLQEQSKPTSKGHAA